MNETAAGRVRVLVYLAAEEKEPLLAAYHEVSAAMDGTPGLVGNELLGAPHRAGAYAVASEWTSFEEFLAWERGPDHRRTTAPIRPFQDPAMSPPFAVYQVLAAW